MNRCGIHGEVHLIFLCYVFTYDCSSSSHLKKVDPLPSSVDNSSEASATRLVKYFTEYAILHRQAHGDVTDQEVHEDDDNTLQSDDIGVMEEEMKQKTPQHIDIVSQVSRVYTIYNLISTCLMSSNEYGWMFPGVGKMCPFIIL